MSLPEVPIHDYRNSSMLDYVRDRADGAQNLMETVLNGMGIPGMIARPLLPRIDRIADRRLIAMSDPYRDEILAIREIVGRPGPVTFSLSYEFGCTARVFPDATLFRTLDWPFKGLGELIEIVHLPGLAGPWVTATWPGVVGCLQGAAPGRFAAALNQAPERRAGFGKAASWIASKRRFMKATGIPPPHLLRLVFETAPDFDTAKRMLSDTPVAAPVIYTLSGPEPGQAVVIERIEDTAAIAEVPAAANHFASTLSARGTWRARGYDSPGRREAAVNLEHSLPLDELTPPILNPLTRLAVIVTPNGDLSVAGWDGTHPVTQIGCVKGAS
ncbi:MAG: carcinine hydrolase/isopenicillin-N N-acyltransferase family protein [Pseudomonadota bacterium]